MSKKVLVLLMLSGLFGSASAQEERYRWVDSVFNTLNRQAKVAQLFMVQVNSSPTSQESDKLFELVKSGVGGVYITGGGPRSHAVLINKLQNVSSRRLLVGATAEWGIGQTLDSVMGFQKPLVIGAVKSDSLVALWGAAMASQMKALGFHINFAPNVSNDAFQGYLRHFGQSAMRVSGKAEAYVHGFQSEGLMAVARYYPGKKYAGISFHDSIAQRTLSGDWRTLNFHGLIFSDAPTIQALRGKVKGGEAELLDFKAGVDVIMSSAQTSAGIKRISKAARRDKLLMDQLNASVKKILGAKYDAGLNSYKPINTDNLLRRINDPEYRKVNSMLAAATVTVVHDADSILPLTTLEDRSFVSITVGAGATNEFEHTLKKYARFRSFGIMTMQDTAMVELTSNDLLVIGIFPKPGALDKVISPWIDRLAQKHKVILVHFGDPAYLAAYTKSVTLIAAYTDQDGMPSAAAQVIFGALPARGELPLNVGTWKEGTTHITHTTNRLSLGTPEEVGVSSRTLEKIRLIMDEAITTGATPGCHVLVVKDGKVIYEQSAGWLTYDKNQPVSDETIYDLASLTKIFGTLQTVMFMHDHGLIDINKKVSVYLPELKNSNKGDFTIKDILTHQAGLWPFVPFWVETVKDSLLWAKYYSAAKSPDYPFPVAENLFATKSMKDSIWHWIVNAKIRDKPPRTPYDYRYSDTGFYIFQRLAEKLLNQPMEDFLAQNLYDPIGAHTMGFLPRERFPADRIAPTENDTLFRKSHLVGYVHDQGAAMHGGVAGHAGLFSTATDLAILGQMVLQKGSYGGLKYFKPETIELFSSRQFSDSRRGLGWDMTAPSDWTSPTARYASTKTFGHTGFTGTCVWMDPEFNLVYVFLSNRVQPNVTNKLLNANFRPRIQQVIYEAIFDYCATKK